MPSGAKGAIRMEHGVPKMTNDGQAILSGLYQSLRINRQQRRSFLTSVLRLFSEDCREVFTHFIPFLFGFFFVFYSA